MKLFILFDRITCLEMKKKRNVKVIDLSAILLSLDFFNKIILLYFIYIQEGSIGHDLVIRPIPDSMTTAQDDEMFMDPTRMEDMVSIDTGLPLGKKNIVYDHKYY